MVTVNKTTIATITAGYSKALVLKKKVKNNWPYNVNNTIVELDGGFKVWRGTAANLFKQFPANKKPVLLNDDRDRVSHLSCYSGIERFVYIPAHVRIPRNGYTGVDVFYDEKAKTGAWTWDYFVYAVFGHTADQAFTKIVERGRKNQQKVLDEEYEKLFVSEAMKLGLTSQQLKDKIAADYAEYKKVKLTNDLMQISPILSAAETSLTQTLKMLGEQRLTREQCHSLADKLSAALYVVSGEDCYSPSIDGKIKGFIVKKSKKLSQKKQKR